MSEERKELWTVLYDTEPDALCMVSEAARLFKSSAKKDMPELIKKLKVRRK